MFGKADRGKSKCKGSETKQVSPAGKQEAGHETRAYKVKLERRGPGHAGPWGDDEAKIIKEPAECLSAWASTGRFSAPIQNLLT